MMEFQKSSRVKKEILEITVFMVYMLNKVIMLFEFLSALLTKHKEVIIVFLSGFINYILHNPVSFSQVSGKSNI